MMDVLRSMLRRLRPVEIDDLGLQKSIENLIENWNHRSNGKTKHVLSIIGNINNLPEPLPVNIYRIVQECLTNIAKHAHASHSQTIIDYQSTQSIKLQISDDGIAKLANFDNTQGIGLLGISERVMALAGQFDLSSPEQGGLTITITIPIIHQENHHD
jgi:two-component system sensor histidine kinase UhpB